MNLQNEYLTENLIAYIGNKRRLLSLMKKAIEKTGVLKKSNEKKFLDLFSGTGVVSRLAKCFGFEVTSNDWEYYSYIINKAFIELSDDFLKKSFIKLGGIENVLAILNNLSEPKKKDKYISEYYCPKDDDKPDLKNERLFYTSYNGKKIDVIRAKINEWVKKKLINDSEETLLIALLLYEASTRSNTSGVFKGFHKGFGGTAGDALTRILKLIELKIPVLINGDNCKVHRKNAIDLVKEKKDIRYDIIYIDPPYNQHQYGSNYHLLNTIALNDKPAVNKNVYINGHKTNKSAIRKDWVQTKSTFCYKKSALKDFEEIIKNINADHILISYSTDGIIEFDDMLKVLSSCGKLDIVLERYVKYRGGKQALTTQVSNIEFVLIVNTKKKSDIKDAEKIKKVLLKEKIKMFLKKTVNPVRAELVGFSITGENKDIINGTKYCKTYGKNVLIVSILNNKIVETNCSKLFNNCNYMEIENIYNDFEYLTNLTKEDEVYLAMESIIKSYKRKLFGNALTVFNEIPYYISKFNNKKAYLPSLKSIISVLDLLIQTIDMWKKLDILNQKSFRKFEKIIFTKLNHNINNEIKNSRKDIKSKDINIEDIKKYKIQISSLYEYLVVELEKQIKEEKNVNRLKANFAVIKKIVSNQQIRRNI